MAIIKREEHAFLLEKQYIMSTDFTVPTSCALGIANTFMFAHQPSVSIGDFGDGNDIELMQHDIVEMRIYMGGSYGDQVYIKFENQWVSVSLSPLFLSKNLHIFAPFNKHLGENPHSL